MPLRYFGDPVLTERAREVTEIDGSVASLAASMCDTMRRVDGMGLAAPQVGVGARLFIYQSARMPEPAAVVNPVLAGSDGEWELEEGCLSMPGLYFDIVRPKQVHLTGWDLDGAAVSIEADEIEARCIQHEMDHLDGVLLLSRLSPRQKRKAMRSLRRHPPGPGDGGQER